MGFAETFKALSDPARREILAQLKDGRLPAGEIAARSPLSGATISYHLSVLKKAGLVSESREKTYIYYRLNTSVLEDVMAWLASRKGADDHGEAADLPDLPRGPAPGPGGDPPVGPPAGPDADPL